MSRKLWPEFPRIPPDTIPQPNEKKMIPTDWTAIHRDDDELLGFLAPAGDGLQVIPTTVFGHQLAESCHPVDAIAVLESTGLSYLADRWELLLENCHEPTTVQIFEASPDSVTVQSIDYEYGTRYTLATPTDNRLQRR